MFPLRVPQVITFGIILWTNVSEDNKSCPGVRDSIPSPSHIDGYFQLCHTESTGKLACYYMPCDSQSPPPTTYSSQLLCWLLSENKMKSPRSSVVSKDTSMRWQPTQISPHPRRLKRFQNSHHLSQNTQQQIKIRPMLRTSLLFEELHSLHLHSFKRHHTPSKTSPSSMLTLHQLAHVSPRSTFHPTSEPYHHLQHFKWKISARRS